MYIYIYIYRERERERERDLQDLLGEALEEVDNETAWMEKGGVLGMDMEDRWA